MSDDASLLKSYRLALTQLVSALDKHEACAASRTGGCVGFDEEAEGRDTHGRDVKRAHRFARALVQRDKKIAVTKPN